ncbi:hypothetical protein T484DRAFT_1886922, partial [Baffinella frigidus]
MQKSSAEPVAGRDMRPVTNERLRRGLELYRFQQASSASASLHLVRDLTMSNDVLNAAEWQAALGGCILYGTDTGRTVSLSFTRGVEKAADEGGSRSPSATDEATFGRPWPAPLQPSAAAGGTAAGAQPRQPALSGTTFGPTSGTTSRTTPGHGSGGTTSGHGSGGSAGGPASGHPALGVGAIQGGAALAGGGAAALAGGGGTGGGAHATGGGSHGSG